MEAGSSHTAQPEHNFHPKYRPDIDGLRAIAILSVVIFHTYPERLNGGFVGVDIFFVISGFLISSIIFRSLYRGDFSFAEFYIHRVRRIFPALVLVLVAAFAFGWFALLPDEYSQLGKHMAAGTGFAQNFVLWKEAGYFDNASELKPLMHLWSLAIEEQFYLIYPALIWAAWRAGLNILILVLVAGLLSFAMNIANVGTDAVWAFFAPQTRLWELSAGAVLAYRCLFNRLPVASGQSRWVFHSVSFRRSPLAAPHEAALNNVLSVSGLLLVVIAVFGIDKGQAFPGWWALAPVTGTSLLIMAGPGSWVNQKILANKVLVFVGLISYPLYLWHWPIISYARIAGSDFLSDRSRIAAIALSFLLAWLTYRLIETPIRAGRNSRLKTIALAGLMTVVGLAGYEIHRRDGLAHRDAVRLTAENNELLVWNDFQSPRCTDELGVNAKFCIKFGNTDNLKIAIIGDSTGNSLAPGIAELYSARGFGLINIGSWVCPPIRGLVRTEGWRRLNDCLPVTDKAYEAILKSEAIDTVVMAIFARDLQYWGIPGVSPAATLEEKFAGVRILLDQDIEQLRTHGKRIIVSYDTPYNPVKARDCMPRPLTHGVSRGCDIDVTMLVDRQPYQKLFDDYFKDKRGVCVVRQSNVLVRNGKSLIFDEHGKLLIRDSHHLTHHGSRVVAQEFFRSGCLNLH